MQNRFKYGQSSLDDFTNAINDYGWVVYEDALSSAFVDEINEDLVRAYEVRRRVQVKNGISTNMEGTLHHLIEKEGFSLKFLDRLYCDKEMKHFLKGNYVVNAFGGVMNSTGNTPYVQNIHRDIRSFMGEARLMVQMMVLLDDFTEENGATYILSGSHKQEEKPDPETFYEKSDRAVAKRGSIVLFDSNLWHAAGTNTTDKPRRVLTLSFTRPFLKQQLDYPRTLGYDFGESLSEELRQVLGYKSRVPANLQEYYQPVHKRMYQPDQG